MIHCLKTWPIYYKAIVEGTKTFEIRKNDRNFNVDDILVLQEFDPEEKDYTGEMIAVKITYKMDGGQFGLQEGFCALGIKLYIDPHVAFEKNGEIYENKKSNNC